MARSQLLERAVGQLDSMLDNAKINNEKKRVQELAIAELSEKVVECQQIYGIIIKLLDRLTKHAAAFRKTRKNQLTLDVKRVLSLVFPDEGFDVNIDWDASRGKPLAKVLTGLPNPDGSIDWCAPKNIHGEFVKQLIGFTVLVNIVVMLNASFFYGDEALNSGDDDSLLTTKPIIDKFREVIQMIVVEHKSAFYSDIDRREICLRKLPGNMNDSTVNAKYSGYVEISKTVDLKAGELLEELEE